MLSDSVVRGDRQPAISVNPGGVQWTRIGAIAAVHLAALATIVLTEGDALGVAVALLSWGALNFFWLTVLGRPALAAVLSLLLLGIIVVLSMFKYSILWMTLNFFDIWIIDPDTIAFLLTIFPDLHDSLIVAAVLAVPLAILSWRLDPYRVRRSIAVLGGAGCLVGIIGVSASVPEEPSDQFQGVNHISIFARSGIWSLSSVVTHGWMEFDAATTDRLRPAASEMCRPAKKPPHIILVLDESSFDITAAPGIKVPRGYAEHFKSFDGKSRAFLVETPGGPTWYTEYNVLTGLSARSYGRFSYYVTRIAAGRVEHGLPHALRRCGYKTFTLYPAYGSFLSARSFQTGVGVQRLIDSHEMKSGGVQPDHFYFDQTLRLIERERGTQPLFVFAYTIANHFPWSNRYRPDLTPDWRDPGNGSDLDEYIRRQSISARDYKDFIARLKREFPSEAFLVVRFGDHQPAFAANLLDPSLGHGEVLRRITSYDPRYYTTYYAIEPVNYTLADLSPAVSPLDAPYLPLVIQELAGLPLDPSFAEQKKIFERCQGLFYRCAGAAEARRFNRLLIDAGLIKGMVSR